MSTRRRDRPSSGASPSLAAPAAYYATEALNPKPVDGVQPAYAIEHESPVIPDYEPAPRRSADTQSAAAVARGSSHRRKESRPYNPSSPQDRAASESYPQNKPLPRPRVDTQGTERVNASQPGGRRYASDPLSASSTRASADRELKPSGKSSMQRPGMEGRRGSVPDRSPLQKLEVTLDDISKEEKRARVAEAELAAQERVSKTRAAAVRAMAAVNAADSGRGNRQSRPVSGPDKILPHPQANVLRRAVPGPKGREGRNSEDRDSTDFADDVPRRQLSGKQPVGRDDPTHLVSSAQQYGHYPEGLENAAARNSYRSSGSQRQTKDSAVRSGTAAALSAAGAYAARSTAEEPHQDVLSRGGGSKRLQKNPSTRDRGVPREPSQSPGQYADPNGLSPSQQRHNQISPEVRRAAAGPGSPGQARGSVSLDRSRDKPLPPIASTAAATAAGAAGGGALAASGKKRHTFWLPYIFHPNHSEGQQYQRQPNSSDWKSVQTAKLFVEDLNIEAPPPPPKAREDDGKAWWEKSTSEKRKSSSSSQPQATITSDGNVAGRTSQTYFRPPLYLKCGPLLRFRGIYTENVRSARSTSAKTREVWRGSIMIVTSDLKSSYKVPPTLQIFKQHVDLLPPPPAEIDESSGHPLLPEYVDPVAGQVKMSRVGKTLYVRPVEALDEHRDLSRVEDDSGLFEEKRTAPVLPSQSANGSGSNSEKLDGEKVGKVREIQGAPLHSERGVTFWKFNIEVELGSEQARIAYRINRGPAIGFWVPARGESMNIMFHSCNGFSLSVDPNQFSGPDPLWRDVLNTHQTRPFHVMIGGGDQVYMDAATRQTNFFRMWSESKNLHHKHDTPFTPEMQNELEEFYLNRYAMWFSQGMFGMANSQIPMVNIWDDHDIIDGYGSYPHHTMSCPVFTGLGAVAFKYYMLFQHQSVPDETEIDEPSWLLGPGPGEYIREQSRSIFMNFGRNIAFLGIDCRTERMRDEILSDQTWRVIFERCRKSIVKGETKHLIVLLGVPIAYPRLNFLENILTSRAMDPIKALGRTGILGGFVNKFDGGVEILDDLDDHWTAKHHKVERNWFILELQRLAATKSVRITLLGGDVHLAAMGQFYSNKKLGIPKDRDHRYMPNVVSSAIVNTPPGDMLADVLNRRNKVHQLNDETNEDMIAMFPHDVDGKPRNNTHLLPHRNWCSIREYRPSTTPPPTPPTPLDTPQPEDEDERQGRSGIRRSLSLTRRNLTPQALTRRFSKGEKPPVAYYNNGNSTRSNRRFSSGDVLSNRSGEGSGGLLPNSQQPKRNSMSTDRPNPFVRRPTDLSVKQLQLDPDRRGHIDLSEGLDIRLNVENEQGDPAGTTTEYRLLVPALDFRGEIPQVYPLPKKRGIGGRLKGLLGGFGSHRRDSVESFRSGEEKQYHYQRDANGSGVGLGLHDVDGTGSEAQPPGHDPEGRSSPLGGWVDSQPAPVSRKPVPSNTRVSSEDQNRRSRNNYPPPSSASPKPSATSPSTRAAPPLPSSAVPHASSGSALRMAADGRPVRNRWRGEEYDEETVARPHAGDQLYGDGGAEEARYAYAYGNGNVVGHEEHGHEGRGHEGPEEEDDDRNGMMHDDRDSPSQRERPRKASWRFWRID